GNFIAEDEERAEELNAFFTSVFNGKTASCPPGLVDGVREQNGPPVIQEEAVRELLRHLDIQKSTGADGIHPRVMMELTDELVKPLSIIFQQSWLSGEIQDDWKLASVMPIHKKGEEEDPGNYRPVGLTSVPSKMFCRVQLSKSETDSHAGESGCKIGMCNFPKTSGRYRIKLIQLETLPADAGLMMVKRRTTFPCVESLLSVKRERDSPLLPIPPPPHLIFNIKLDPEMTPSTMPSDKKVLGGNTELQPPPHLLMVPLLMT
ncbi:hypothetical protein HGM15179_015121, partial [Zosterops borbonicus]